LFLKSLELYRAAVLSELQRMLREADSPLDGITRVMQYASQPPRATHSPSGCLMANTALEIGLRDPDVAVEVKKLFRSTEKTLAIAVKRGQERGEITTRFDAAAIAQSLANTINGIRILQNTGASDAHVRTVVEMALAAITV
jgi:TetR/AcrR family transcriptional repressor of nem operon